MPHLHYAYAWCARKCPADSVMDRDAASAIVQVLHTNDKDCVRAHQTTLSTQMATLSSAAIERLASHPFLLADIQFQDECWWRQTAYQLKPSSHTTAVFRHVSHTVVIRLMRATLMFVWHATRTHHDHAIALLGIKPRVLEIIASLRLHDLDQIAEHHFTHLTPRWFNQPDVWKPLLDDAIRMSVTTKINCNLRSLQLFAGQYIIAAHHATE